MSITSTMLSLKSAEEQEWKELYTYIIMLEHREKELKWFNDILEQQNLDKAKEIERLNNKVEELMELYTTERHCKDDYKYIINELEKWLNEEYDATIFDYHNAIEDVIDKLIELKGSGNNE